MTARGRPVQPIELSEGHGAMRGVPRYLAVLAVAGLLLGACGGGGGGDDRDEANAGGVGAPSRTSRTQPPGGDPDAVQPYIEELLARYDQVVDQIVTDPSVARDRDNALIREYLSLYEPGSGFADQLIDAWVQRADDGLTTRPLDDEHPISASHLDGDVESRSDDEVAFPYCVERHFMVFDGAGRLRQRVPGREQRGDGVAVRVDGEWRLRELAVQGNTAACRSEGS